MKSLEPLLQVPGPSVLKKKQQRWVYSRLYTHAYRVGLQRYSRENLILSYLRQQKVNLGTHRE